MPTASSEVHRLSYEDVMRMVDAGVLGTADRVELIDGVLHDMSPLSPTHIEIGARLGLHFTGASPEDEARVQDLLVVKGVS